MELQRALTRAQAAEEEVAVRAPAEELTFVLKAYLSYGLETPNANAAQKPSPCSQFRPACSFISSRASVQHQCVCGGVLPLPSSDSRSEDT